ncbi:hypothetical protein K488DRAFT_82295 [Vararia minispora EC-137]|uniref:Uncharacterized protein n=1 Tax=Vararia minispora EC-137 TaxID=1314806 RepID=A0ACB8QXW2_9AGAM|nr:hypothetical protein K488DRAFT_82295 [Vararia minispora EC-137]
MIRELSSISEFFAPDYMLLPSYEASNMDSVSTSDEQTRSMSKETTHVSSQDSGVSVNNEMPPQEGVPPDPDADGDKDALGEPEDEFLNGFSATQAVASGNLKRSHRSRSSTESLPEEKKRLRICLPASNSSCSPSLPVLHSGVPSSDQSSFPYLQHTPDGAVRDVGDRNATSGTQNYPSVPIPGPSNRPRDHVLPPSLSTHSPLPGPQPVRPLDSYDEELAATQREVDFVPGQNARIYDFHYPPTSALPSLDGLSAGAGPDRSTMSVHDQHVDYPGPAVQSSKRPAVRRAGRGGVSRRGTTNHAAVQKGPSQRASRKPKNARAKQPLSATNDVRPVGRSPILVPALTSPGAAQANATQHSNPFGSSQQDSDPTISSLSGDVSTFQQNAAPPLQFQPPPAVGAGQHSQVVSVPTALPQVHADGTWMCGQQGFMPAPHNSPFYPLLGHEPPVYARPLHAPSYPFWKYLPLDPFLSGTQEARRVMAWPLVPWTQVPQARAPQVRAPQAHPMQAARPPHRSTTQQALHQDLPPQKYIPSAPEAPILPASEAGQPTPHVDASMTMQSTAHGAPGQSILPMPVFSPVSFPVVPHEPESQRSDKPGDASEKPTKMSKKAKGKQRAVDADRDLLPSTSTRREIASAPPPATLPAQDFTIRPGLDISMQPIGMAAMHAPDRLSRLDLGLDQPAALNPVIASNQLESTSVSHDSMAPKYLKAITRLRKLYFSLEGQMAGIQETLQLLCGALQEEGAPHYAAGRAFEVSRSSQMPDSGFGAQNQPEDALATAASSLLQLARLPADNVPGPSSKRVSSSTHARGTPQGALSKHSYDVPPR